MVPSMPLLLACRPQPVTHAPEGYLTGDRGESVPNSCDVKIQYFAPSQDFRRYCNTFFLSEIVVRDGGTVEDYLFPEWGTLRIVANAPLNGVSDQSFVEMRSGYRLHNARFPVIGPRTQEMRFRVGTARLWSINFNPVGWARYVREPAHKFANVMVDGYDHPAFAQFLPLAESVFGPEPDPAGELERISAFFENLDAPELPNEDRILEIFITLLNPRIRSVSQLAQQLGIGQRTLERICLNAFGFSPKMLLRRQRFMRSLTDYTLDPSLKWIGAMDALYHDQAQFVRDFREFMGMTPSEFAALEKPVMTPVMRERVRYLRQNLKIMREEGDNRDYGVRE